MTEVGGEGAAYFDPTSPRAAAQQIAEWWKKRPELVAHGLVRSSEWNQSRMIDRYIATYARIAAAQPAPVLA
jgi:hypothetical protein